MGAGGSVLLQRWVRVGPVASTKQACGTRVRIRLGWLKDGQSGQQPVPAAHSLPLGVPATAWISGLHCFLKPAGTGYQAVGKPCFPSEWGNPEIHSTLPKAVNSTPRMAEGARRGSLRSQAGVAVNCLLPNCRKTPSLSPQEAAHFGVQPPWGH